MADNLRVCWERAYERFWEAFDSCFTYKKTARRAREYVRGLMATFEEAKQKVGLDEYEVRSWEGWYRHISMSMIDPLLINILKALERAWFGKK